MSSKQSPTVPELGSEYSGIPRVIVAEDDEVYRGLLCDVLRECGLNVKEARDGVELLEILAESAGSNNHADRIDLVVSDVCVPEYRSIEVMLGMHATKMGIPLITITAFGERRAQVLTHQCQTITLEEDAFDLDGFREIVLDLLKDRRVPKSMRITLRPPGAPTQRPPGLSAISGEPSRSVGSRSSTMPPQMSSMC